QGRRRVQEGPQGGWQGQERPLPRPSWREHHLPGGEAERLIVIVLGIETSCDDSAAALVAGGQLLASVVSSQDAVHGPYGGIVPELASRQHLRNLVPVIEAALGRAALRLDDVEGIAVTRGPGLVGSLLVGLSVAKGLAQHRRLPL